MKLSDIATTVHHHQQLPVEIVKTLRQNFKHPEPNVHHENKVRIRTDQHYRPDKGTNYWKTKYRRHVRQRSCGFYTPAHIPYETVGDVVLDLKDLVHGPLGYLKTTECKTKTWRKIKSKPKDKLSKRRDTIRFDSSAEQQAEKPVQTVKKGKEKVTKVEDKSPRNNGGLNEIRQNLQVHRKRVVSVRAGKPYFDCVREEAAQKAAALLMQQNNKPERCISPTRLRHFVSKMRVERTDTKSQGDRRLSHEPSNEDILRASKERSVRNFTAKLNCLYDLLCSLYNLRTKDLRTKNLLSKEFIKTLRASIPLDHRGRLIRTVRHTANPQSHSRAAYHRSSTDATELRMVETDNFPVGSPHMFARPSCMYDSASSIFKATTGENVPSGSGTMFLRKFGRGKEGGPKILEIAEMTWEELLEGKSPQPAAPQEPTHARNAPGRSSFLAAVRTAFRTRRTGILHHLPQNSSASQQTENLTLWQQVASNEKNAAKADARSPGIQALLRRRRTTPINTLADIIGEDFGQIRKRTAQNVKDKLEQCRVRERKIFTQKMKTIAPAWIYETDLKAMRHAGIEVHRDFEDDNLKPAEWHMELTKEAETLTLSNNPNIKQFLDKFYPFSVDDVHSVSFVKAKLCLLMQSLPLYDLCSIPMQEALHFLMTQILDGSPNALSDWMAHRKLLPLPPTEQKQNS